MKKEPLITTFIGGRLDGAITAAVMAAETHCGRQFPDQGLARGIIGPTKERAAEVGKTWQSEARSARCATPDKSWKAIVFIDAQHIRRRDFARCLAHAKDSGAAIFIAANPPTTKGGQWLIDLQKSKHVRTIRL